MKRRPYFGWRDCKLHLFNAKHATPKQREALAPFEGVDTTEPGGGTKALDAIQIARNMGIALTKRVP